MNSSTIAVVALLGVLLGGVGGAKADSSGFEVSLHGGSLSVAVLAASLADVLQAVGERTGVQVELRGDVTTPITATFTDVPIDEGIKRLARGYSVCLLYGASAHDGLAVLREAWIIASSPPVGTQMVAGAQRRATWLAEVQRLGGRQDAGAVAALVRLVAGDEDPVVRAQAAKALGRAPETTAGAALVRALGSDPDAQVRRMAARVLGALQTEEVRRALEAAARDPNALVRQEATRALSRSGAVPR